MNFTGMYFLAILPNQEPSKCLSSQQALVGEFTSTLSSPQRCPWHNLQSQEESAHSYEPFPLSDPHSSRSHSPDFARQGW